jgi:MFS family permease
MIKSLAISLNGNLGSDMFAFALGLMLLQTTGSSLAFAFTMVIGPLISIVTVPIVGPLVDRISRKTILMTCQLFSITALTIYGIYYLHGNANPLLAASILIAANRLSDTFLGVATQASKKQLLIPDHLHELAGYQSIIWSLASVLSKAIGGILYAIFPFFALLLINIACETLSLALILSQDFTLGLGYYDEVPHADAPDENGIHHSFIQGVTYLRKQPYLLPYMMINMLVAFAWTALSVGLPILVLKELHQGSQVYGGIEAVFSLGMIVGGLIFAKMKESATPLYTSLRYIFLCGFGIIALGLISNIPLSSTFIALGLAFILFLMGICNELGDTPFFVFIQRHVPNHIQGRINSLLNTSYQVLTPIGLIFFGWVLEFDISASVVFIGAGLFLLATLVLFLKSITIDFRHARILSQDELD